MSVNSNVNRKNALERIVVVGPVPGDAPLFPMSKGKESRGDPSKSAGCVASYGVAHENACSLMLDDA